VAAAAGAAELKIGYVDLAAVFARYERTKVSEAALEEQGKRKEAELEALHQGVERLRQNLELLNDEARDAKARELDEKVEELRQLRARSARELGRERDRMVKGLLGEIRATLEAYAKAQGLTLVLDARSLVYGETAYDVTDEVIAMLNERATAPTSSAP
jgi:outer membrane protein